MLSSYIMFVGIFGIIIGSLITAIFLFFSSRYFITKELKRIFRFLSFSVFFLFLYFFSYIYSLFFDLQKNIVIIVFQVIFIILNLTFLIYSSILIYNISLDLGFASPKNVKKIKRFMEKKEE